MLNAITEKLYPQLHDVLYIAEIHLMFIEYLLKIYILYFFIYAKFSTFTMIFIPQYSSIQNYSPTSCYLTVLYSIYYGYIQILYCPKAIS